jgi:hypothetical protein
MLIVPCRVRFSFKASICLCTLLLLLVASCTNCGKPQTQDSENQPDAVSVLFGIRHRILYESTEAWWEHQSFNQAVIVRFILEQVIISALTQKSECGDSRDNFIRMIYAAWPVDDKDSGYAYSDALQLLSIYDQCGFDDTPNNMSTDHPMIRSLLNLYRDRTDEAWVAFSLSCNEDSETELIAVIIGCVPVGFESRGVQLLSRLEQASRFDGAASVISDESTQYLIARELKQRGG